MIRAALLSLVAVAGLAAADVAAEFAKLARDDDQAGRAARDAAAAAVWQAHPDQAPSRYVRAVEQAARAFASDLERRLGGGTARAAASAIAPRLEPLRAKALANIERYNQAAIDTAVAEMRALWDDPLAQVDDGGALEVLRQRRAEIASWLDPYPDLLQAAQLPTVDGAVQALADAVRVALAPKGAAEVMAYNARLPYLDAEEHRHLQVLNSYRMMLGLMPLESDVRLFIAARDHSRDMQEKGFFDHTSPVPGKRSFGDRATLAGYGAAAGENILRGQDAGAAAFDGWYHSEGHHQNMTRARFTQIGAARHQGFWTQVFGTGGLLSSGRPPKEVVALEQILGVPADAGVDDLKRIAGLAANAGRFADAVDLMERALALAPDDAGIQRALDKLREQLD